MKVAVCEDADWLLSEEAFSIYASCMYHPTYNDYVGLKEDYLSDTSKKSICIRRSRQENRFDGLKDFRRCR